MKISISTRQPFAASTLDGEISLVILTARFEAARGVSWDGPRHFEPSITVYRGKLPLNPLSREQYLLTVYQAFRPLYQLGMLCVPLSWHASMQITGAETDANISKPIAAVLQARKKQNAANRDTEKQPINATDILLCRIQSGDYAHKEGFPVLFFLLWKKERCSVFVTFRRLLSGQCQGGAPLLVSAKRSNRLIDSLSRPIRRSSVAFREARLLCALPKLRRVASRSELYFLRSLIGLRRCGAPIGNHFGYSGQFVPNPVKP
ncbi:hypothetical protein AVEN_44293-1 [Araneus ventricosus]|uniref:Uncharacterized protein n=1 Tax=Araneus ventricosus TaxID=182803 RepID=A0A4Y2DPJ8_ARAVE|nr:hypothetical protein AVEN_44293-1 [Araneus ventricosus]